MLIGVLITGIIGLVLMILGFLIWKKEKIDLLHDYHYDNVREVDKKAFCTLSGIGIFVIGISLLVTALLLFFTDSAYSFLTFATGFTVGLLLLLYAGTKYNQKK